MAIAGTGKNFSLSADESSQPGETRGLQVRILSGTFLCVCVCVCVCVDTLGSRGYFFLMDTDGSRRSRVNEAQSAEEKKITFFSPRRFFLL